MFGAGPDFAGDVAFEAAHDFGFGFAFGDASGDVGTGGLVVFHADDDDAVQCGVGLAVSAAVESVALGFAAGGRDGASTAEFGEGGLVAQALGVLTKGEQQFGGVVGADADGSGQLGSELIDQGAQQFFRVR